MDLMLRNVSITKKNLLDLYQFVSSNEEEKNIKGSWLQCIKLQADYLQ